MRSGMKYKLGELIDTISDTRKIEKDKLVLINTSDVLNGKVLNHSYTPNNNLRGQFKKRFQKGDILYSEIRPGNRRFAYVDFESNDYIASTKLMVLRNKGGIVDNNFLYLILSDKKFTDDLQFIAEQRSGTFPQITFTELSNIDVVIPDLETQKKIVRILSVLDQKIELINCENCTIENTLQSHFNNWIDNMKPIAMVGLDEIAKYTNGLAMQKFRPGDNDLGLPVVKIKEMNSGISKDTERCTSELKEEYTVFPGDVLFAWSGTLCMKIWDGEVAGLNQHIFKVTSDEYPKWFYYFWTKKHLERFINIAKGKATTMGHIQRKELSLSKVLIPNEHELKKQDGLFKPLLEKIISNNSQRQSLIHLRDTILPKLMSGEINLDKVMTDE